MSNTYTKILLHIIFAVKGRESLLPPSIHPRLYSYIGAILKDFGHMPIAIGGIENHVHVFFDYKLSQPIPDLVRELKTATTKFINNNHLIPFKFSWQRGYSCFSYASSQSDSVKNYVEHQYEHHKNTTLQQEIKRAYELFDIQYNEEYIFE